MLKLICLFPKHSLWFWFWQLHTSSRKVEKPVHQIRDMLTEDIQAINGEINRWGIIADNQIVGAQDVLLLVTNQIYLV